MEKILVIEDEESILMALEDDLVLEGYDVTGARDGLQGFTMAEGKGFDLIILDIMLPKMNGFDICRQLRQKGVGTPILMLTAKSQEIDKVLGLELGADDYVTKPFSPRELIARVKAILRRTGDIQDEIDLYRFDEVEVDFKKREVTRNGRPIDFTRLEFDLLRFFIQHKDRALSREVILNAVWGEEVYVYPRTVDTHVAHLRQKIEADPANPQLIVGVRGVGYRFTA